MAIPYFRMANCHTIIGAKRFHFRVRDGIGWFTLAMVTKQTGVLALANFYSTGGLLALALGFLPVVLEICNAHLAFFIWAFFVYLTL